MRAMEIALEILEQDQYLRVKQALLGDSVKVQATLESWLVDTRLTRPRYLSKISNISSEPDGLFIWLIAQCLGMHINLIHTNGIWSTRCSGILDLWDPAIVFVLSHYLATPTVHLCKDESVVKRTEKTLDESMLSRFAIPANVIECFVLRLPTLNRLVCSVADKYEEFGLAVFGETIPL